MPGKFRKDWPQLSPKKRAPHQRKASSSAKELLTSPPPEPKEQHCIRCHSTFYDDGSEASRAGCIVPHVYREEPIYLMGGNFTYESDCCGESFTINEHGAGTGCFKMVGAGTEPCFVGEHTIYTADVAFNGVNVFRCVKDGSGRCMREVLVQRDEPVFLDWGSSSSSSVSEEGHFLESVGQGEQSIRKVKYGSRRY